MDSPLLPQMKRNPDVTSSPTAFISNLSLNDPSDDSFLEVQSHSQSQSHSQYSRSSSSNASTSYGLPPSSSHNGDEWGDETPHKPKPPSQAQKAKPRFSLFAPSQSVTSQTGDRPSLGGQLQQDRFDEEEEEEQDVEGGEGGEEEDQTIHPSRNSAQRDEKLRESLYELRQMNDVFNGFLNALESARGHNERLAERVKQTSQLLDQYTALLGQTEHTQNLILNPKWTGAQDDAAAVAAEEAERIAIEEAAAAEAARRIEELRAAEEFKERQAAEAARLKEVSNGRGGARGRGTRGLSRGSGIPPPSRGRVPSNPTTGLRKPSGGLGGQYANVKSSGYGPKKST